MILAWPVFLVFVIFDTTQAIGGFFIRGTGKQATGMLITLSAYWVFGLPLSVCFSFWKTHGIQGLWYGPTVATLYCTLFYNILIKRIDWAALIKEVRERREKENPVP